MAKVSAGSPNTFERLKTTSDLNTPVFTFVVGTNRSRSSCALFNEALFVSVTLLPLNLTTEVAGGILVSN